MHWDGGGGTMLWGAGPGPPPPPQVHQSSNEKAPEDAGLVLRGLGTRPFLTTPLGGGSPASGGQTKGCLLEKSWLLHSLPLWVHKLAIHFTVR